MTTSTLSPLVAVREVSTRLVNASAMSFRGDLGDLLLDAVVELFADLSHLIF